MHMLEAVKTALLKSFDFSGRATRAEFWYFIIFAVLVGNIIMSLERVLFYPGSLPEAGPLFSIGLSIFFGPIATVFALLMILPWVAVSTRRLHDVGRTGFWMYFGFIPPIGWLFMLVWLARESEQGENEYGPNPLGEKADHHSAPVQGMPG